MKKSFLKHSHYGLCSLSLCYLWRNWGFPTLPAICPIVYSMQTRALHLHLCSLFALCLLLLVALFDNCAFASQPHQLQLLIMLMTTNCALSKRRTIVAITTVIWFIVLLYVCMYLFFFFWNVLAAFSVLVTWLYFVAFSHTFSIAPIS